MSPERYRSSRSGIQTKRSCVPLDRTRQIWSRWPSRRIRLMIMATLMCWGVLSHVSAFSLDFRDYRGGGTQVPSHTNARSSRISRLRSCLRLSHNDDDNAERSDKIGRKKKRRVVKIDESNSSSGPSRVEMELLSRMAKLEALVAKQQIEIRQLNQQNKLLAEAVTGFARVVELLREAGLKTPEVDSLIREEIDEDEDQLPEAALNKSETPKLKDVENATIEYFDDSEIFGRAPSSVIDAADAAGAAILAGMLGGKQRMLVDVRDAELSRDSETLVQFIELAILPVAAALEGLTSSRNRVKIVFPTVSQLLEYRRTMALAAPDVVALSTLGFDPVENVDNVVVLMAPSPDDEEGLLAMNELLEPTDPSKKPIPQPLVVLNYHMVPVSGPAARFEVAYHLRLLSVQFMTGNNAPEDFKEWEADKMRKLKGGDTAAGGVLYGPDGNVISPSSQDTSESSETEEEPLEQEADAALEAAMQHARELGVNQGVTRAMVIRAYPRPWHVFVDTSPDTDADFEVAATFDEEPTQEDVNYAIVECLEGSETEDELVAQQMQQALESGQLDQVAELLGQIPGLGKTEDEPDNNTTAQGDGLDEDSNEEGDEEEDDDDDDKR